LLAWLTESLKNLMAENLINSAKDSTVRAVPSGSDRHRLLGVLSVDDIEYSEAQARFTNACL
jgi:hypothetical protein